ncbi:acyltransferase family protein [Pseudomonas plecoglossicida]
MSASQGAGREYCLDSLRGIAALIVLFSHTTIAGLYKVEPLWSIIKWTPLKVFWSGHQAVILFFMLSGFALTRMWQAMNERGYGVYVVSRVLRLYPPYLASIALALAVYAALSMWIPWEKMWMNVPLPNVHGFDFSGHLLMVGVFNPAEVNGPIWSIIHEMRISLVFPAIYLLVARFGVLAVGLFVVSSVVVSWLISGVVPLRPLEAELLISLHYSTFFAIGSFVAMNQAYVVSAISRARNKFGLSLWVFAILAYAYPFDNPWSLSQRAIGDLGTAIGAFLIIGLVLGREKSVFGRVGDFLGKISYSLYLNHILGLNIALLLFYKQFGAVAVWPAAIVIAVSISYVMYIVFEKPSVNISRFARRRLSMSETKA